MRRRWGSKQGSVIAGLEKFVKLTPRIVWVGFGLIFLTVAGMVSVYQVLFSLWMTAYPYADINFWRPHLYIRLAQTVIIAVLWGTLAVWILRKRD